MIATRIGALCLGLALLAASASGARAQDPTEVAFWSMVKESKRAADIKAYLEAYPRGAYAEVARQRLSELERMPAHRRAHPRRPSGRRSVRRRRRPRHTRRRHPWGSRP